MEETFRNTKLQNLHGLENWDIRGLRDLNYTFRDSILLEDISALENWDASGLTRMQHTFEGCTNLTSLTGLENWNTSNITDLNGTFSKTGITNLNPLARKLVTPESGDSYYAWDTSAMTSLSSTFRNASSLSDISGISNWNIQPESLGTTFSGTGITSVAALRDWDVSNLTSINSMLENTSNLTSLSGLENWGDKLGNLRTASWTFANSGVEDATNLNSWVLPSFATYGKNRTFDNTPAAANGLLPSWY
jgi:surface protein